MSVKFSKGMSAAQAALGKKANGESAPVGCILFTGDTHEIYLVDEIGHADKYSGDEGEVLDSDKKTVKSVGNIPSGTTLDANTSAMSIIKQMLFATFYPYIETEPSANIDYSSAVSFLNTNDTAYNTKKVSGSYVIADNTIKFKCITTISRNAVPIAVACNEQSTIYGGSASGDNFKIDNSATLPSPDESNYVTVNGVGLFTASTASVVHTGGTENKVTFSANTTKIKDSEGNNAKLYSLTSDGKDDSNTATKSALSDDARFTGSDENGYSINTITVTLGAATGSRSVNVKGYLPIYVMDSIRFEVGDVSLKSEKKLPEATNKEVTLIDTSASDGFPVNVNIIAPSECYLVETAVGHTTGLFMHCPTIHSADNQHWEILLPATLMISEDYAYNPYADGGTYEKQPTCQWKPTADSYTIHGNAYKLWRYDNIGTGLPDAPAQNRGITISKI